MRISPISPGFAFVRLGGWANRTSFCLRLLTALLFTGLSAGAECPASVPVLYLAIATHSEDIHNPETPDYGTNKAAYVASRNGLIDFARLMQARGIQWNWQCDWNFLNAAYTNEVLHPDPTLLAATANTNIVAWLRYVMFVETDPHSHENDRYNYADVAYLFTRLGVTPSPVVGGHVYDPAYGTAYQDWTRFLGPGLRGMKHTNYVWRPQLLMGAGTPQHVRDPVATGLWLPADTNAFFTHSPTGGLASWGMWDYDRFTELLDQLATNALPANRLWTAGLVLVQQDFVKPGYLTNVAAPLLDTLAAWRDSGRVRLIQFEEGLRTWTNQFGATGEVRQAPQDCVTFALNIQDFSYPELSAAVLDRAITLHESVNVPLDVLLTTTMIDLYRSNYPALFSRLATSSVVALAYHIRPPTPYYIDYDWLGLTNLMASGQSNRVYGTVMNYETHALNIITGSTNNSPGGYALLRDLAGYSPYLVGAATDAPLQGAVATVFRNLGARLIVEHGRMVNLTNDTRFGLFEKPEHFDLHLYDTNWDGWSAGLILSNCFAAAHATNGAVAPWFVGVKMHDNDFFATTSAWVNVYVNSPRAPPWTNAYTKKADLLPPSDQTNMWNRYEEMVRYVASNRDRYAAWNGRGILRLLGQGPEWPLLRDATIAEAAPLGTASGQLVAVINRTNLQTNVTWRLVSGPGDCDNARFTLTNGTLRAAAIFDHETQPTRLLRVRLADTNALGTEQYLAVTVTNILTDDDDGDGFTEAQELLAGTDPLDAHSALRMQPTARTDAGLTLAWAAITGRSYILQTATNLFGPWIDLPDTATNATEATVSLPLPIVPPGNSFYRVRLVTPRASMPPEPRSAPLAP